MMIMTIMIIMIDWLVNPQKEEEQQQEEKEEE